MNEVKSSYKELSPFSIRIIIYFLFFLSGLAGLIYEILWSKQFVPVFGNSAYAISIVLTAFMTGLGIGSLWFGRYADRHRDRLLLYSILEGGIALSAFLVPFFLQLLKKIMPLFFSSISESLPLISFIRFIFSFTILFIPCFLMGGTLPVLSKYCTEELKFVGHRISLLYGLNTFGAAARCFLTGFFLIETIGLSGTNNLAISTNLTIGLTVIFIRFLHRKNKGKKFISKKDFSRKAVKLNKKEALIKIPELSSKRNSILIVAFITGLTSLSLEVLWTRYLSFRIPSNAYSFSSILGVFLIGLGIGSLIYRLFLASYKNQILILSIILFISGSLILIMLSLASELVFSRGLNFFPFIPVNLSTPLGQKFQSINFALMTILIPTILMGITFPSLCKIFTQKLETIGESIGKVYAINTAGAITGSLLPVFLLSLIHI